MPPPDLSDRVKTLVSACGKGKRVLVLTHDNPDPDSLASAWALAQLLEARAEATCTIAFGGVLGRAENRTMVRLLRIPVVPFARVNLADFDVVGLVDTQPGHGNHALAQVPLDDKLVVCIDHHPRREAGTIAFADIGGDFGATSTMLSCYLEAAGIDLDAALATALFYGIKGDTRDLGREVGAVDVWAYTHLIKHTNMSWVSEIEHPRLPRGYYAVLSRAVKRARCYDDVVVCDLGPVYVPDLVAETADWLLYGEGIRWSFVVGEHEDQVYVSIRVADRRYSAGKLIRSVVEKLPGGSAGGHGSMAGARIPLPTGGPASARTRVRRQVLRLLLRAGGVPPRARPRPFTDEPTVDEDSGARTRADDRRRAA